MKIEGIYLCRQPNKCCTTLEIIGTRHKKYKIVTDNGESVTLKKNELKELCKVIKNLGLCNEGCC